MSNNLKRHYLPLVVQNDNGEYEVKPVFTPEFIPFKTVISATKMAAEIAKAEDAAAEQMMLDKMIDFVVNDIYRGTITREDIEEKLHAPDALETIKEQIAFVSQGYQTKEAKDFVKKYLKA